MTLGRSREWAVPWTTSCMPPRAWARAWPRPTLALVKAMPEDVPAMANCSRSSSLRCSSAGRMWRMSRSSPLRLQASVNGLAMGET